VKAVVQERYGPPRDVLDLRDVDEPSAGEGEVLVRVDAAGISIGDWLVVSGMPYFARPGYGLTRPKQTVAGLEVAGRVEAVGSGVSDLEIGDEVFGFADGAFAELVAAPAVGLVPKPESLAPEQAAALPVSGTGALQAVRDAGKAAAGESVLIIGASGAVGTFAVQVAKALGTEVTAVCSTRNVDLVRKIGADTVIDYTSERITDSGRHYDLIVDVAGNNPLSDLRSALTAKGRLIIVGGSGSPWSMGFGRTIAAAVQSPFVGQQLKPFFARPSREDLTALAELADTGNLSPVIDRSFPLSDILEAYDHVGGRHTQGKSVITV
jgi:2-desacetyl-2-hydroxyethyl bacteriochlorophyllide A dehydrogenase